MLGRYVKYVCTKCGKSWYFYPCIKNFKGNTLETVCMTCEMRHYLHLRAQLKWFDEDEYIE